MLHLKACVIAAVILLAVVLFWPTFDAIGIESEAPVKQANTIQHPVRHHSKQLESIGGEPEGQSDLLNQIQWALKEVDPSEARAEDVLTGLFQMGRYSDALYAAQALERGLRRELLPTAVEAWAMADGQAAWDAVAMLASRQPEMRLLVLHHWPDSQTHLLGNLILGMPNGTEKSAALGEYIHKLGQSDPAGLSEWLVAHPQDTAVMDQAAEFFVFSCDSENRSPEVAAQWAARISSPERRELALEALVQEQQMSSGILSTRLPKPKDAD